LLAPEVAVLIWWS